MKKLILATLTILISVFFLGSPVYAEWDKEGSGDYRSAKQVTFDVLAMGEERRQINTSQLGMVVDAPPNSPFQDATFNVLGSFHRIGNKFNGSGFIEYVCTNGDKIYATFTSKGVRGKTQTTVCKIVDGTGKCTGIQGLIEIGSGPTVKPAKKGIFQSYSVGTISWKIP